MLAVEICLFWSLHWFGVAEESCHTEKISGNAAIVWASDKKVIFLGGTYE